ncbi:MAG: acyl-CoA synthetase [Rhodococcus sp.]|uniref:acyl-CoA synthetase n=1 Tax=Rhodococcus TaxID=1827 RepID=UPI0016A1D203|nr:MULTISPECIES: acyl-CoA synthetase [Rhodococcus]NLV81184.1 acyl-CoA synthetase [Rhodococcus sp. (in: high G+C Gram-positive bacteria)]
MSLNLADLIEAVVDAIPDRLALACEGRTHTYAQFDAAANRIGHHLAGVGVGAGDHVGVHMRNSLEFLDTMLGTMKIRAVPININFRYVGAELEYLYNNAELTALVVDDELTDLVAEVLPRAPKLRHIVVVGNGPIDALTTAAAAADVTVVRYSDAVAEASSDRDFAERSSDDLYILYTGGTTGMPKGVMWRHEDFYYAALGGGSAYGDPHDDPESLAAAAAANTSPMTYVITAPLMHGAAMYALLMGLFMGFPQVVMRNFEPAAALRLVDEHKAAVLMVVGDAIARPIADVLADRRDDFDLSSLMVIGSGGALWSVSVRDQLTSILPNIYLHNSFGSSESGANGSITPGADGRLRLPASPKMRVVDVDFSAVEPGSDTIGYLARIGHVPVGYFRDEEKTAATFVEVDGERLSILGDLASVEADGTIVILGRGSACINSGGEKIYAEEVEEAVKGHPSIEDALVAGVPDDRLGEKVSVVVQLREGAEAPSQIELADYCRSVIAGYKVPRHLVVVPEIVRSPAGKADYRWAKSTLAQSVPAEA